MILQTLEILKDGSGYNKGVKTKQEKEKINVKIGKKPENNL
tara:strand:- start:491 stop:613 length:123 start_codon:yes stop_codon:yes gene_type:complete